MCAVLVSVVAALATAGTAVAAESTVGARTVGDRLFPQLGNGGYDAKSYDVSYDYRPGVPTMDSSVTMSARATQGLSEFSLDSVGQRITAVTVDGRAAKFRTEQEKLIIDPAWTVHKGATFAVKVDYVADRSLNPPPAGITLPPGVPWPFQYWVPTPDGFAFMGQPDRAHLFFPSNDHPSDKARFTFRVTTPNDVQAVANGKLVAKAQHGDRTTYVYRTADEIPTDVTQVAVGKFQEIDQTGPHGLPIRSFVPAAQAKTLTAAVQRTPDQIAWIEQKLGLRFPFENYGVLALDSDYDGVALETATLSTYSARGLALSDKDESPTMAHELTHQFFGDAVSVGAWDDMWISEGHARYYEKAYAADRGFDNLDARMKQLYEADAQARAESGPPAHLKHPIDVLFSTDNPGALMLYGLRQLVGDQTFHDIERAFFTCFNGRSATTKDYIDTANRIAGRDLTGYIRSWLHDDTTPPMPGHPDWVSNPN